MKVPDSLKAVYEAEARLWKHFDLSVTEREIRAGSPALRVRVLEFGDPHGPPLVFAQGGLGEAHLWVRLLVELRDHRCIAFDRPGGGFSDAVDFQRGDLRALAADVLTDVLDATGLKQGSFVANSMGAWWTLHLALRNPERVERMVLLGCPALLLDSAAPLPMRLMSLPIVGGLLARAGAPRSPAKARNLPGFLGHPLDVGRSWTDPEAELAFAVGQVPQYQRSWHSLLRRYLRLRTANPEMAIGENELKQIRQPTLLGWGKSDPFGSLDVGRRAAALMPNASLEVVGVGHLPWWDDAHRCADLVRGFTDSRALPGETRRLGAQKQRA